MFTRLGACALGCLVAASFTACSGSGSSGGTGSTPRTPRPSIAYSASAVGPGAQCAYGGVRVDSGIDDNGNGSLDPAEIKGSEYVCNGAPGSLVDVTPVSAGVACAAGGLRVRTGVDTNSNGTLDTAEVRQTEYVCNGQIGAGANTLVRAAAVPPGTQCPNGGYLMQAGVDANGNGQLEPEEVSASNYVCNGTSAPGSVGTLVDVTAEPAGSNCPQGGVKISVGTDDDGNGVLAPAEVDSSKFVCNAAPGASGVSSLVRMSPVSAGAGCATGGFRVETGTDDNRSGVLDDPEVDTSQLVCNGASTSPLVRVIAEPAGAHCAAGGVVVQGGLDLDGDHVLGAGEVTSSEYLCNAQGGGSGPPPASITPVPLVVAPNGLSLFSGTLDTSDLRLPDGTRAKFYSLAMGAGGILDLSAVPQGAVEFHVFTNACLSNADLATWSTCFVGNAPRQRVAPGQYVIMAKGTETAYLWGTTHFDAILRRSLDGAVAAATLGEHVQAGLTKLESGLSTADTDDFLGAADHFTAAANLIGVDGSATPGQIAQARFFGALARVVTVMRPYSDLVPSNGLNELGDILDGFGLGGTTFQRSNLKTWDMNAPMLVERCGWNQAYDGYNWYSYYSCNWDVEKQLKPFPADSPRGQDLQAFLADKVKARLDDAIALLEPITAFSAVIHDAQSGKAHELDLTDAVFLKAVANGMAAFIEIQRAYDLDLDIDEFRTDMEVKDDQGNHLYGPDRALAQYPFFGRLKSAASLPGARTYATKAVQAARDALAKLAAETDDQSDDLFTITDQSCTCVPNGMGGCWMSCTTIYNPAQKIQDTDRDLAQVENVLTAPGNYVLDRYTPADTSDDVTVNASKFFDGSVGVDLRAMMPATFQAGRRGDSPGMLPDPTFGGVLVSSPVDLTADKDSDGSPDFFNGYSWFFPSYLNGYVYSGWDWSAQLQVQFAASGNRFSASEDGFTTFFNGSWAIDPAAKNALVLTFDVVGPRGEKTIRIEADEIRDGHFEAWVRRRDAGGMSLPASNDNWVHFSR